MTFTFENFDADLLKSFNSISYKYVIFSPKVVEKDDCFEYLHDYHRDGDVDRCLQFPREKLEHYVGGE